MLLRTFFVIVFILYVWAPQYFERNFFFNELISLYGMFVLWNNKRTLLNNYVIKSFYPFLILFGFSWFFSFLLVENTYILLRRLSIFYSVFCVFALYDLTSLLKKSKLKWVWFFAYQKVNLLFGYMFLASDITKRNSSFWIVSFIFIVVFTFIFGGSTAIFSLAFTFFIFHGNRLFWCVSIICFLFFISAIYLVNFESVSNDYFVDIYDAMGAYEVFSLDGNITVRLFMWWRIISETLPSTYGLGVGFGTVLFDESFIRFLGLRQQFHEDSLLVYTLSPHNSFLYFLATMGVPGIMGLFYMYFRLWKDHVKRIKNSTASEFETRMFMVFIAYSFAAALNVIIESPIHSGLYWGILGMYVWAREQSVNCQ